MTLEDKTAHNVMLRTNNVLAKMRKREIAFGCQFNSPSSEQVELLGIAGYDFVIFDGEHGSFTLSDLEEQSRVAQMCGLTPAGMVPDVELADDSLVPGAGHHGDSRAEHHDGGGRAEAGGGVSIRTRRTAESLILAGDTLRFRTAEAGVHGSRELAGGS